MAETQGGQAIGPFRVLRELGRGGQAVVWLAEDTRFERQVALKVLPALGPGHEEVMKRFRREAEAASRLDHPGICTVFEADVDRGVPYIAMRYVPGQTLAQRLAAARDGGKAPPSRAQLHELAALFEKVARALHSAHEAGIVHRDVKPANIMVTAAGEPVVLDFGLARHDEGPAGQALSVSGEVSGTPAYMSPEQMTGRAPADRRTDIYAVGATLYECATLRHPFEAATRESLYHAILTKDAPDARLANPAIERDLAVILETTLAKERDRRYQSCRDLAEDLRRFRENEPILARPASRLERARRWAQRNPALAASFGAAILLLVLASAFLAYGVGAAGKARAQAELRRLADEAHGRAEAERLRLDQLAKDRQVRERLEELLMQHGMYAYSPVLNAAREARAVMVQTVAALRDFGIDLEQPGAVEPARARLEALQRRDQPAWDTVCSALRHLHEFAPKGSGPQAQLLATQVDALWRSQPGTQWEAYDRAVEAWDRDHKDEFAPLLADGALRGRSASQLGYLGATLALIPGRETDGLRLLDRALRLEPGNFQWHFLRGVMTFVQAFPHGEMASDPDRFQKLIREANHHYGVAVALRPASGVVRSMLATTQALAGQYQDASHAIEEATRLEPDNAMVWLLKAHFYSYTPMRDRAVAACKKALELDPELTGGRELLAKLSEEKR